jgi:hypothetical protein
MEHGMPALIGERGGIGVWPISHLLGGPEHLGTPCRRDPGMPAQRQRHGHHRDAKAFGDIAHGNSGRRRIHWGMKSRPAGDFYANSRGNAGALSFFASGSLPSFRLPARNRP